MLATPVTFVFAGLIAFISDPQQPAVVHAILPSTSNLIIASDGVQIPHHRPFVAVAKTAVSGSCPDEASLPYFCSMILDYENVTVEGTIVAGDTDKSAPIVGMETIVPSTMAAQGELLDPKPERSLVAARFTVSPGSLSSASACGDTLHFKPIVFNSGSGQTDAVVADVAWAAASTTDSILTIRVKKFNSLGDGRTLVINTANSAPPIYVVIGNTDPMGTHTCEPIDPGTFDRHFEVFYELAADVPSSHSRPVPFELGVKTGYGVPDWLSSVLHDIGITSLPQGVNERVLCPVVGF